MYDLTNFLNYYKGLNYNEEQKVSQEEQVKNAIGSLFSTIFSQPKQEVQKPKQEIPLDLFRQQKQPFVLDDLNFSKFTSSLDIEEIENIQKKAITKSNELIARWQSENNHSGEVLPILELHKLPWE